MGVGRKSPSSREINTIFKRNGYQPICNVQKEQAKMERKTASADAATRAKNVQAAGTDGRKSSSFQSVRRRLGWKPSHDIPRRREGFHHLFTNQVIQESTRYQES